MTRADDRSRLDPPVPALARRWSRRAVLSATLLGALATALRPRAAWALASGSDAEPAGQSARRLRLLNTHTGERADVVYHDGRDVVPGALSELDRVLRDHRTNEVHPMAPATLDIAWAVAAGVGRADAEIEIISGYRSKATNDLLRATRTGIASHSLHCDGRALDLRIAGTDTRRLRDAALVLARGGVGYYGDADFIHVDDGRVRRW